MSAETSPAGEADSSNDSDSNNSCECPTCGDEFKNTHGMRIHHSQAHDESIAWVEVACDECGGDAEIEKYELGNQDHVYCSPECQHEALSVEKVEVVCSWCGTTERVKPSREPRYEYCSPDCKAAQESETWAGENGPNYRGRVEITCKYCGDTNHVRPSRSDRKFCNADCHYKWRSENIRGENHPLYNGGWDEYYGPNWRSQRRKARKRDHYQCRICGKDERDLGQIPSTHHITKMAFYQNNYDAPEWYDKGNRLDNLILLCEEHHNELEKMAPLCPQLV